MFCFLGYIFGLNFLNQRTYFEFQAKPQSQLFELLS